MAKTPNDPEAVDEYLANLNPEERHAFEGLRDVIKATVPEVRERISYGPAVIFARNRDLVGIAAQPKHLSFFTMSPQLARAMAEEIKQTHKVSGATIHFTADKPLPSPLVQKVLDERLKDVDGQQ